MSGSRRDVWKEILNRFDPDRATHAAWRAEREGSPAGQIVASLDRPVDQLPKVLLTGTIGTGKSTELLRIAELRAAKGNEFVVVLDLVRHFRKVVGDLEALQNVTSWEVCFLCGLALIRAAKDELGYDFPQEHVHALERAWSDLAKASQTSGATPSIDIPTVIKSMTLMASTAVVPAAAAVGTPVAGVVAAGGLKILSEIAGAGKWTVSMGRKGTKPIEDQDELLQTLADKVNVLMNTFRQWNRPVLMVVDGLDRITDDAHAESLFLRSQMIAGIDCALVVCAPFALRNSMAASEARGFRLRTLHNAPVLDHEHPERPMPQGCASYEMSSAGECTISARRTSCPRPCSTGSPIARVAARATS